MKFSSFRRAALAAAFSLGLAPLLISCGNGHTFGFAYVLSSPSATTSSIWVYKINNQTGQFNRADNPSIPTVNYNNPVYALVSPDNNYLYVLFGPSINSNTGLPNPNGQDAIVVYGITHKNGNITPLNTYNTGGTQPVSLAIDPAGNYLYAVDYYQEGFTSISPGPGDLSIYSIDTSSGLLSAAPCAGGNLVTNTNGNICFYGVGYGPQAATQTANAKQVYVTNSGLIGLECSGSISGFNLTSTGLSPITFPTQAGSCSTPATPGTLPLGSQPWAITSDATSSYAYVTDFQQNVVYAMHIDPATGNLTTLQTAGIGNSSRNILIDPTGAYLYISSSNSNQISAFNISGTTGTLTSINGAPFSTGTLPLCMAAETPFLYAVNQVGGSVSGFSISPAGSTTPGALYVVNNQPFQVSSSNLSVPTCMAIASFP